MKKEQRNPKEMRHSAKFWENFVRKWILYMTQKYKHLAENSPAIKTLFSINISCHIATFPGTDKT